MSKTIYPFAMVFIVMNWLFAQSVYAAEIVVDTNWLAEHLESEDVVLIDMSSDYTQYQRFHIPGAIYLGYDNLIQYRKKDKVAFSIDNETLYKLLGLLGISQNSHVVIYDDMGGLNAGRLYWNLERIGHQKISIVDGGLVKWVLEGRTVDNKPVKPERALYTPNKTSVDNVVDLAKLAQLMQHNKARLLDVRTREEYIGYKKYPRTTGHIPGASFWPWENNVDFGGGFVLKDNNTLERALKELGVTQKDEPLVVYCQSGHRAAQSYMTLKKLGYKNVRLYDGSMAEYSQHKNLPIKQGNIP